MTRVAIIPARGGSKRIPRKNIRTFCGKPMIAWSIDAALKSDCFDRIIVSTDNSEIAEAATSWGAELPFMRPAELADEYTGTIPVIRHAVDWLAKNDYQPEQVCCIYATAPFITPADIRLGLEKLELSGCEYAFSVTTFAFPIQRALRITAADRVEMFSPGYFEVRSQDLEEAWHDAGQFYWGKASAWQQGRPLFTPLSTPVPIPRYRVQDIDTIEDWKRAELMHQVLDQAGELV